MQIKLLSGHVVLVDRQDCPDRNLWHFNAVKQGGNTYCSIWIWDHVKKKQIKQMLHRYVMRAPKGMMVCHLNGNGLDCRRKNLAFGTHHNNGCSIRRKRQGAASAYRGVHINRGRGKQWTVQFWDNGKSIYLGRFDTERDAAKTYDTEVKKRFGKFAHLNFP